MFSLRLPHPLCSAFSYPIHYVQPSIIPSIMFSLQLPIHYVQTTITPSIIFSLQLPHPLYSAYNYPFIMFSLHLPHSFCSAYNYPIHYIQPTITPSIMFSIQLPHSLCSAYNYPIYGTQWHPEKNAFFWNPRFVINHSKRAVKAAEYFARFFVSEGESRFVVNEGESCFHRERDFFVCVCLGTRVVRVRACVRACVCVFVRHTQRENVCVRAC